MEGQGLTLGQNFYWPRGPVVYQFTGPPRKFTLLFGTFISGKSHWPCRASGVHVLLAPPEFLLAPGQWASVNASPEGVYGGGLSLYMHVGSVVFSFPDC